MPLRTTNDAPKDGSEVVARYLGDLFNDTSARQLFKGARRSELWTCPPFRSYVASLSEAADGRLLNQQPRGWRYVVCARKENGAATQPLFTAEVSQEARTTRVTHLSQSPELEQSLARLADAEGKVSVKGSSYEVRLLEIIGLSLSAWWLRDPEGKDLFIPTTSSMPELASGALFPKEQFLDIVARQAGQRLQAVSKG